MKKLYVVLLALAVAVSFGAPAMAKQGLSVGGGLGVKFDASGMGATIMNDGLSYMGSPASVLNTQDVVIPENTLVAMKSRGLVSDLEQTGSMTAIDLGLQVRYDLLGYLFARTGFNYNSMLFSGETSWKYTALMNAATGGAIATGAKHSQTWDYSAWAIPFNIGLNIPIADGKFNIYAGIGLTYASGEWSLEVEAPANGYAWVGAAALAGPAFTEKVTFKYSGIGFNYLVGFDAEVHENISVFIELENQFVAGMSDDVSVKNAQAQTVLGTSKLAYPVIPGGSIYRFGAKYALGFATL